MLKKEIKETKITLIRLAEILERTVDEINHEGMYTGKTLTHKEMIKKYCSTEQEVIEYLGILIDEIKQNLDEYAKKLEVQGIKFFYILPSFGQIKQYAKVVMN